MASWENDAPVASTTAPATPTQSPWDGDSAVSVHDILPAIEHVESRGNAKAVGPMTKWGTAKGPYQLLDSTAKSLGVTDPHDPAQAKEGARKLLEENYKRYGNWDDAIRAYHGGTDRKQWGPKTAKYLDDVLGSLGNTQQASNQVQQKPWEQDKQVTPQTSEAPAKTGANATPAIDPDSFRGGLHNAIQASMNSPLGKIETSIESNVNDLTDMIAGLPAFAFKVGATGVMDVVNALKGDPQPAVTASEQVGKLMNTGIGRFASAPLKTTSQAMGKTTEEATVASAVGGLIGKGTEKLASTSTDPNIQAVIRQGVDVAMLGGVDAVKSVFGQNKVISNIRDKVESPVARTPTSFVSDLTAEQHNHYHAQETLAASLNKPLLQAGDKATISHEYEVANMSSTLATRMGLSAEDTARTHVAGTIHDEAKAHPDIQEAIHSGKPLTTEQRVTVDSHAAELHKEAIAKGIDPETVWLAEHHHDKAIQNLAERTPTTKALPGWNDADHAPMHDVSGIIGGKEAETLVNPIQQQQLHILTGADQLNSLLDRAGRDYPFHDEGGVLLPRTQDSVRTILQQKIDNGIIDASVGAELHQLLNERQLPKNVLKSWDSLSHSFGMDHIQAQPLDMVGLHDMPVTHDVYGNPLGTLGQRSGKQGGFAGEQLLPHAQETELMFRTEQLKGIDITHDEARNAIDAGYRIDNKGQLFNLRYPYKDVGVAEFKVAKSQRGAIGNLYVKDHAAADKLALARSGEIGKETDRGWEVTVPMSYDEVMKLEPRDRVNSVRGDDNYGKKIPYDASKDQSGLAKYDAKIASFGEEPVHAKGSAFGQRGAVGDISKKEEAQHTTIPLQLPKSPLVEGVLNGKPISMHTERELAYALRQSNYTSEATVTVLRQNFEHASKQGGYTPALGMKFRDYSEATRAGDTSITLTPAEQQIYNSHIQPLRNEFTDTLNNIAKLSGTPVRTLETELGTRLALDQRSALDRLLGSDSMGGFGRGVKKPGSQKGLTYYALEDGTIVSGKEGGGVLIWKDGEVSGTINSTKKLKAGDTVNGQKVVQAQQRNIEDNTATRYVKDDLATWSWRLAEAKKFEQELATLESLKQSDFFKTVAMKRGDGDIPKAWRPLAEANKIPQMRDYYFEPKTAEVFDDWVGANHGDRIAMIEALNNISIKSFMINPTGHINNEAVHWFGARGLSSWVTPYGNYRLTKTFPQAVRSVLSQDHLQVEIARQGGHLLAMNVKNQNAWESMLSDELKRQESNGTMAHYAEKLGMSPVKFANLVSSKASSAMWTARDFMYTQLVLEHQMTHPQASMQEAIMEVNQHMPSYEIPSRVLGSRTISQGMQNRNLTVFSAYHYGMLNSLGTIGKELSNPKTTLTGLDHLAALVFVQAAIYPALDYMYQQLFNDPNAQARRAGPLHLLEVGKKVASGEATPTRFASLVLTPSPSITTLGQLFENRYFYSGQPIYNQSLPQAAPFQVGEYMFNQMLAPGQAATQMVEGKMTWKQYMERQSDVESPNVAKKGMADYYKKKDALKAQIKWEQKKRQYGLGE